MELKRFTSEDDLSRAAADLIVEEAREAVARCGTFTLALSGGRTPKRLYELLAKPPRSEQIPWKRIHIFWGDERCLPPDHGQSNFALADKNLLAMVPLPEENIHRMQGEVRPPEEAASLYEQHLRAFFGLGPHDMFPGFDLTLLGVGPDGHTASLFPESPALFEARPWVVASQAPPDAIAPVPRLTLTLPVLNTSKTVLFLVVGEEKRQVVKAVAENQMAAAREFPAARVIPRGRLLWFVDEAAYPRVLH